jgi:hypothetical protein
VLLNDGNRENAYVPGGNIKVSASKLLCDSLCKQGVAMPNRSHPCDCLCSGCCNRSLRKGSRRLRDP